MIDLAKLAALNKQINRQRQLAKVLVAVTFLTFWTLVGVGSWMLVEWLR